MYRMPYYDTELKSLEDFLVYIAKEQLKKRSIDITERFNHTIQLLETTFEYFRNYKKKLRKQREIDHQAPKIKTKIQKWYELLRILQKEIEYLKEEVKRQEENLKTVKKKLKSFERSKIFLDIGGTGEDNQKIQDEGVVSS